MSIYNSCGAAARDVRPQRGALKKGGRLLRRAQSARLRPCRAGLPARHGPGGLKLRLRPRAAFLIFLKKALAIMSKIGYNYCRCDNADVAQEVEHFLGKEEVSGSSPDISSIFLKPLKFFKLKGSSGFL